MNTKTFLGKILVVAVIAGVNCMLATQLLAQATVIDESISKMPSDANAVLVVNVQQIRSSQVAKTEGWFESLAQQFQSGMGFIPSGSDLFVVAANVDQRTLDPKWTVALMRIEAQPIYDSIRKTRQGTPDEALGQAFTELPNNMYVFPMNDQLLASYSPAERQHFVHWLRQLKTDQTLDHSYLQQTVFEAANLGNQLIFAVDLEHAYSQMQIFEDVRDSEFLTKQNIDAKTFAKLASSVTGFSLRAMVRDKIQVEIQVDFAEDISSIEPVAHDLVLQILDNGGVAVPESIQWRPEIVEQSIRVGGTISTSSFRRVISLLDAPEHDLTVDTTTAEYRSIYSDPAEITKHYFDSLCSLIDDLRNYRTADRNFVTNAIWFEKFADRIERLPTHNVDESVLAFSDDVVKAFIESATKLRLYGEQAKTESSRLWAGRGGGLGGGDFGTLTYTRYRRWGRSYGGTGLFERRYATQKIAAAAADEITLEFEQLLLQIQQLKRQLTAKYDLDF